MFIYAQSFISTVISLNIANPIVGLFRNFVRLQHTEPSLGCFLRRTDCIWNKTAYILFRPQSMLHGCGAFRPVHAQQAGIKTNLLYWATAAQRRPGMSRHPATPFRPPSATTPSTFPTVQIRRHRRQPSCTAARDAGGQILVLPGFRRGHAACMPLDSITPRHALPKFLEDGRYDGWATGVGLITATGGPSANAGG